MTQDTTQLIIGASLAGAKAAEALRAAGFDGPVTLIGAEDELPYERPPLSKDYLQGKADREKIYAHPADWYAELERGSAPGRPGHRASTRPRIR